MYTKNITMAIIVVFMFNFHSSAQEFSMWVDSERDSLEMGVTNELDFKVNGFRDISALQLYFKLNGSLFDFGGVVAVNESIEGDTDVFYDEASQSLILLYYSGLESGVTLSDTARLFSVRLTPLDSLACFSTAIRTIDEYDEVIVERSGETFIPVNFIDRSICVRTLKAEEDTQGVLLTNFISPDGDGKNDQLIFNGLQDYPVRELRVFTMWGKEVYYAEEYNNDWDAVYRGSVLPDGNYYYVLEYGHEKARKTGSMLTIQSD